MTDRDRPRRSVVVSFAVSGGFEESRHEGPSLQTVVGWCHPDGRREVSTQEVSYIGLMHVDVGNIIRTNLTIIIPAEGDLEFYYVYNNTERKEHNLGSRRNGSTIHGMELIFINEMGSLLTYVVHPHCERRAHLHYTLV